MAGGTSCQLAEVAANQFYHNMTCKIYICPGGPNCVDLHLIVLFTFKCDFKICRPFCSCGSRNVENSQSLNLERTNHLLPSSIYIYIFYHDPQFTLDAAQLRSSSDPAPLRQYSVWLFTLDVFGVRSCA